MTLGELRKAIEGLPDDLTVVFPGGEWDYQEVRTVSEQVIEWQDGDAEDDAPEHDPTDRRCLIVE
jgi:hypothetical protein